MSPHGPLAVYSVYMLKKELVFYTALALYMRNRQKKGKGKKERRGEVEKRGSWRKRW